MQKFLNYLIQVWNKYCLQEELSENTCSYLHLCLPYMKGSISCHVSVQFLVVRECEELHFSCPFVLFQQFQV